MELLEDVSEGAPADPRGSCNGVVDKSLAVVQLNTEVPFEVMLKSLAAAE